MSASSKPAASKSAATCVNLFCRDTIGTFLTTGPKTSEKHAKEHEVFENAAEIAVSDLKTLQIRGANFHKNLGQIGDLIYKIEDAITAHQIELGLEENKGASTALASAIVYSAMGNFNRLVVKTQKMHKE